VRCALQAPARQIAENAGFDGAVVAGKMLDQKDTNFGFDAQKGEYADLVMAGIIDPVKVVRTALQDASSAAGLLVMTEAMVAEKPEKKAPAMPPGGGMGGSPALGLGDRDIENATAGDGLRSRQWQILPSQGEAFGRSVLTISWILATASPILSWPSGG
jgi:hypothetical protein